MIAMIKNGIAVVILNSRIVLNADKSVAINADRDEYLVINAQSSQIIRKITPTSQ